MRTLLRLLALALVPASLAAQAQGSADELPPPPADDGSPQSKSSPADTHRRRFGRAFAASIVYLTLLLLALLADVLFR